MVYSLVLFIVKVVNVRENMFLFIEPICFFSDINI